jgi:hypothetical protein
MSVGKTADDGKISIFTKDGGKRVQRTGRFNHVQGQTYPHWGSQRL